jgi:uncharacterized protein with von Willebrand factor type A (vWA) domain
MAVYCLIDRSGSMETCIDDTIGGFNTFVKDQSPDTMLSLTLFDNEIKHVYTKKVSEIEPLDRKTYIPRGGTALLDAIGYIIKSVPPNETPCIVILTDGCENSSKKYTKLHISDLIREKKKMDWTFVFLAANQDAIESAGELGIPETSALTFDTRNVESAFRSVSHSIRRQQTGETQGVEFTPLERSQAVSSPT